MTLAIFKNGDEVLLGLKKRGLGAGLWNGFGGKVDPGETVEEAMVRECQEEAGITPTEWVNAGKITFINDINHGTTQSKVYLFLCTSWESSPRETEEMSPKWFNSTSLPYEKMWDADGKWIPLVLAGKKLSGNIHLGKDREVKHADLREVA